jgi:uncharacterized membrane protein YvbJ
MTVCSNCGALYHGRSFCPECGWPGEDQNPDDFRSDDGTSTDKRQPGYDSGKG